MANKSFLVFKIIHRSSVGPMIISALLYGDLINTSVSLVIIEVTLISLVRCFCNLVHPIQGLSVTRGRGLPNRIVVNLDGMGNEEVLITCICRIYIYICWL